MSSRKKEFHRLVQRILQDGKVDAVEKIQLQEWLVSMEPLPDRAALFSLKEALVSSVLKALKQGKLKISAAQAVQGIDEITDILFSFLPDHVLNPVVQGSSSCQEDAVYFSGMKNIRAEDLWSPIEEVLKQAKQSVDVAAFNLTYDPLRDLLMELARKNIAIHIFAEDASLASEGSDLRELNGVSNIEVKIDGPESLMHHKFMIIDDGIVINGSMNFTRSAVHRNFENIMIVRNPEITRFFVDEFELLWTVGQELPR